MTTVSTTPRTFSAVQGLDEPASVGTLSEAHVEDERQLPDAPPSPVMEAFGLNVYYGDFHAVHDVNLSFGKNEITALIGPSGCGKWSPAPASRVR